MLKIATRTEAVVVGVSAGGVEALGILLPALPAVTPFPVVIVVHLPPTKPSLLVDIFTPKCALPVCGIIADAPVAGGTIWFAPPDYHVLIEQDRTFGLSISEPVNYSRPSIDVLFESAAEAYGKGLVGVVLTGASADGALGASRIKETGGAVVVQDPKTAEATALPTSALRRTTPDLVGTLPEIAAFLRGLALARTP